ncbi:MAG: ATP-dependent metallopeptidase FtsH/Yme1/Tma family protein, partial [Lachnospiraceae bacterium]|nr:ATP-dependent metallopeptidase FtsH/Yme1/Tma family protein [Lachnospiraceae bacterium]
MNENNNQNNKGPERDPKNRQTLMIMIVAAVITILFTSYMSRMVTNASTQEITYTQFMNLVSENQVESVVIEEDRIVITPKITVSNNSIAELMQQSITYYTGIVYDPNLAERLINAGVNVKAQIPDRSGALISIILSYVLPILLVWAIFYFLMRKMGGGGGMMG